MKGKLAAIIMLLVLLATSAVAGDYIIGDGDALDISVWGVKELNVSVRVRPDGKITIPGLGDVMATGTIPKDLQKNLEEQLRKLVKNPIVTVTVKEITNSKVYVFGGGVKSGVFDLRRRTTLLQLLCSISDLKMADLRKSYVLRNGKKVLEDFHRLFVDGEIHEDLIIESNDSVYIPPLFIDKNVYVLGAVNSPKFIEYREGLTVMDAILEAGGFSKFAQMNDTTIHRKENNLETVIEVKAKDIWKEGNLAHNIKLRPNDYVIVREGMF